jgi:CHAD domain-containing protein
MKASALTWKASETAESNARRVLPRIMREYFKAGRKLVHGSSPGAMHRFRLKTKRLRYTLEAFIPVLGAGLQPRLQTLRLIQNTLGDLNDCEVLLAEMGKRLPRNIRTAVVERAEEKRKEFLHYWRGQFDAADEDTKWEKFLTRSVRTGKARRKSRS